MILDQIDGKLNYENIKKNISISGIQINLLSVK